MRGMGGPEGHIQEEGPVGPHALGVVHEPDGVVDEVLAHVVAAAGPPRGVDVVVVAGEGGAELVGLALEESVVAVEATLQRPLVEGPGRTGLLHRREVPFADGEGCVALVVEHLGEGCGVVGDVSGHVGEAGVEVRHGPHPDGVVVASGEQGGPGR